VAAAVPATAQSGDPGRPDQWALDRIGAEARGGAGVTVAVLDTGVDLDHADLRDRVVPGVDLLDGGAPRDRNGHGTHVAGIIAASAGNGIGVAGVAPDARIMPVRVLDERGDGTLDHVVAGVRWAVDHGADVLNLSLSEDTQAILGPSLAAALREAWAAGVVPVIAAGNQYVLGSGFADEPAIVVAATTRNDGKPSYSSAVGQARWGMAAPGGENPLLGRDGAVLSTWWVDGETDQYAFDAGTSMAAPHVAGAVAVLLGLGLSPAEAVDRLLATAVDIGEPGWDSTFGAGRLDLAAATAGLRPSGAAPGTAPPPDASGPGRASPSQPPASSTTTAAGGGEGDPAPTAAPSPTAATEPGGLSPAPVAVAVDLPVVTTGPGARSGADRALPAAVAALLALASGSGAVTVAAAARRRHP